MRCVFCQNSDISHHEAGVDVRPQVLADMMLALQAKGCHNINFVTLEHVVPQVLEALPYAVAGGLRLPIVYNTSAFDSLESLRHMEGIVGIYMPDFKYWDPRLAQRYLKSPKYPGTDRAAIKEMHRQVGDLVTDDRGLAQRGLLARPLVMPGGLEDIAQIMRFLAEEVSPNSYVNVMGQYYPAGKVSPDRYGELNRGISRQEMGEAYRLAYEAGLHRFDERWLGLTRQVSRRRGVGRVERSAAQPPAPSGRPTIWEEIIGPCRVATRVAAPPRQMLYLGR